MKHTFHNAFSSKETIYIWIEYANFTEDDNDYAKEVVMIRRYSIVRTLM